MSFFGIPVNYKIAILILKFTQIQKLKAKVSYFSCNQCSLSVGDLFIIIVNLL